MKKLLGIVVLNFIFSMNAHSHDDPNHAYLECQFSGAEYAFLEIDFKKNAVFNRYGFKYEIIHKDKLNIAAKREGIILNLNRYSGLLTTNGREIDVKDGFCVNIKKQF
tara:strand:- start:14 stop:337 length:324 start_codon:yes stop_codon:yes gene_type:complete